MPAPDLKGFQRKYLRGLAHGYKPVVQVGEKGITESVVNATHEALLQHELVKVRLRAPEDKKAMAEELAQRTESVLCGLIGHTLILYRAHPEKPTLHVPTR